MSASIPEARPRWAKSDRLAVNPFVVGASAAIPAPAEPRPYASAKESIGPETNAPTWLRPHPKGPRGFPPRRWVWSVELGRVMDAQEAATMAGVQVKRLRFACTPSGQAQNGGSVGRATRYRFRWATEAEVAAGVSTHTILRAMQTGRLPDGRPCEACPERRNGPRGHDRDRRVA